MTQYRTRRWSSDEPGPPHEGDGDTPLGEPEPTLTYEVSGLPAELIRPDSSSRSMDPATSEALASLKPLVQPPPPPVASRTLSGFAPRGTRSSPDLRPSEPAPPPRARTISAWSPRRRTVTPVAAPAAPPPVAAEPRDQSEPEREVVATYPEIPPPAPSLGSPSVPPIAAVPAHARGSSALFGWSAAAALLTFVVVFYALAYAPLRNEVDGLQQAASQLKERDAEIAVLRAEVRALQKSRAEAVANAAAAATPQAPAPPVVAIDAKAARAAERREAARAAAEAKAEARAEAKARKSAESKQPAEPKKAAEPKELAEAKSDPEGRDPATEDAKGVDRAAAAAATAALEAEAYGGAPKPAEPAAAPRPGPAPGEEAAASEDEESAKAPQAPAAEDAPSTGKRDALEGIERESSDDPLEGL